MNNRFRLMSLPACAAGLLHFACLGVLQSAQTRDGGGGPGLWLAFLLAPGGQASAVFAPDSPADIDGDGAADGTLRDRNGDGLADGIDWDGDGQADANLPDGDGNGMPDGLDQNGDGAVDYWFCPAGERIALHALADCSGPAARLMDANGDGTPDGVDTDGDGQIDDDLLGQIQSDLTAPVVLIDVAGGTYASAFVVRISCTDNLAPGAIGYSINGPDVNFAAGVGVFGAPPELAVGVGLAGDGGYLLKYACRDARGNFSNQASAAYTLDSNAPDIAFNSAPAAYLSTASGARNSTLIEWTSSRNGTFVLRRNASDCSSGDVAQSGTVSAGAPENSVIQAGVDFASAGARSFILCVTDSLNGLTGSRSFVITRDDTPPTLTLNAPTSAGPWPSGQTLDLACTDGGAGCAARAYSTDGVVPAFDADCGVTAGLAYASGTILPDGAYTLRVRACDGAGNASTTTAQALSVGSTSVKRIFVSAASSGGNLGGLAGANAFCTADANNPNGGTYKALLSGNGALAANQAYVRGDGVTELGTANASAVLATPLTNAVGAGAAVWTGFGSSNCANWTSSSGTLVFGSTGDPSSLNSAWLNTGSALCNAALRVYCVEQ